MPVAPILTLAALLLTAFAAAPSPTAVGPAAGASPGSSDPAGHEAVPPAFPVRWGAKGHQMAARAAADALPEGMPYFFTDHAAQLVYLNPEPDRWRSRPFREMDQAFSYDHYIDLENVPEGALDAPDRYEFLKLLYEAGLEKPERDVGFLPFHIVELYQRLVTEWRLWRETPGDRRWIEARILNDAGTLGHYVTDASQPHHTTIHFNGWNASNKPGVTNPEGYTEGRDFHGRFEAGFVNAHVEQHDVSRRVGEDDRSVAGNARAEVLAYIRESHAHVETLYRLERDLGFGEGPGAPTETVDFAAERLAAGAEMLRTLWWSAWVESGTP